LPERDVQRADAAADRRGQWPLDRDQIIAAGFDRRVRQPGIELTEGFFAGEDFEPVNLAFTAIGARDRRIEHAYGRPPDVGTGAVAFDVGNDRIVRNEQFAVPHLYLTAAGRRDERWTCHDDSYEIE